MVSAIQTVPSAYITSQIVRQAVVSPSANQANLQLVLPSTTVSLDMTISVPVTYNASGLLDTGSSSESTTDIQSYSTQAIVVTTNAAQDAASIKLAADLEASTIAENLAVLDKAFDDALARQFLVNSRAAAAELAATADANASLAGIEERIEASRQIEIDRQVTAANNAITLDELFAARGNETNTENAVNVSQNAVAQTDSAATLQLITPQPQPITNESSAVMNTTQATTANVVAASNTTTNNLSSTSEVANSLVGNPTFDAVVQIVTTTAQYPAYANLVAQNYASVAASSGLSPSVTAMPITPEDATAAFAISSITDLTQSATTTPVVTTSKDNVGKTDRAATLPLLSPLPQPITNPSITVASTTPATIANVVAASNTTTNSPISTAEVANSPVPNPVVDSAVQAVTTVGQNPAYANLVAGNYVGMAASSAQSPSITAPPMRLEDIKPVISIPAITALSQLSAQYGRDGNPAWGNRQRAAIFNAQARPARAAI